MLYIHSYKLQSVGLPEPAQAWASYTSQTCPECGHSCKENRITRDAFQCKNCGFEQHADIVGALNVAGSYICFEKVKHKLKKGKVRAEELKYQNWLVDNLGL